MVIKRLLFIILILASAATIRAQVGAHRSELALGVSGGYVLNKVSFNPTIKQDWKGGTTFGITARYTCEKYFSAICALQGEINYARMGWKEKIETSDDTYERSTHYIQVPLLARLAWGREQRGAQFFLLLGPQIGFFLDDNDTRTGPWTPATLALRPNQVTAQYDLDIQRKFEYGLTGGIGLEVSTKIGHFQLEGRYFYALSDMFDNGKKDPFGRSANGAIIVKASYLIDIFRKN